jgi:hypothetical protein
VEHPEPMEIAVPPAAPATDFIDARLFRYL